MQVLKRVIGLVLDIIRPVLPVRLIQDIQTGGNNNTAQRQHQPAMQESKPKRKRVQVGTQVSSRKAGTLRAQIRTKKLSTNGTQPATPAPQAAPKKSKPKRSPAPSTIAAQSHKTVQKAVPVISGDHGKQPATPVFPILRPAKSKPKAKP